MLDLAISVGTDQRGTTIVETNDGVRLKAPEWPQDCEFQLVAFTSSARTCQIISADELADDIRKALAALDHVGVLKPQTTDWHRRLRLYAYGAGHSPTDEVAGATPDQQLDERHPRSGPQG